MRLAGFRGYFLHGRERSTHGQKTHPPLPKGLPEEDRRACSIRINRARDMKPIRSDIETSNGNAQPFGEAWEGSFDSCARRPLARDARASQPAPLTELAP